MKRNRRAGNIDGNIDGPKTKRVGVIGASGTVKCVGRWTALSEVLRVAIPLMISTGLFSVTLFVDRTFLLWYDGKSMGAAMAAGNVFWVSICGPIGIVSMTGAIIAQYVGAGQSGRVGRLLWQSVWMSLAFLPLMAGIALLGPDLFRWSGQDPELWAAESTYLRVLMIGGFGAVLENALAGFFSGTHRTAVILWSSLISSVVNIGLDALLIFGLGTLIPEGGITGAAVATVISIYFKVVVYASILLLSPTIRADYQTSFRPTWNAAMFRKLLYFGFPTGLMYVTESGAFTVIILQIGKLGDIPLRATTMAINFNMVAFIPLVGVSIAASVLVGQKLTQSDRIAANDRSMNADDPRGPTPNPPSDASPVVAAPVIGVPLPENLSVGAIARAAIAVAWVYSGVWAMLYFLAAAPLVSLYSIGGDAESAAASGQAGTIAIGLLGYVSLYIIADATQLTMAGILRGAGDTWFVWLAGITASVAALALGFGFEPEASRSGDFTAVLNWWWWIILIWIWFLATTMTLRYASGAWLRKRMV